ncbi:MULTISPECIES: cupin domain-containing protein [unclassified Pseudomonas]|uniref:cupin domain-containing protein n=1 Tax=unclassified Pseudomonas TaxID=196821 RepID=UPI000BDA2637|nr:MULTISPECIES: cupin domain-containing protein [unclassified Pseudomonas]PVZ15400.1 quercetin dioxygenase-like cupin family protein [Pseudomonas sp. URIL14HWK12:I12]PVZ24774.1 quercetin dioxygenase-like cupin family protein [Pseudomonas sp. URIL14HWK12:I10]PVZ34620.1 quercetin dioxygenase-like cupin family protein [Pseudomonas sp. URIL14HWK12:I11]SNZ08799.1 Cupin domain protein [Pseudomonas sp. URIL14HWK12:I9]
MIKPHTAVNWDAVAKEQLGDSIVRQIVHGDELMMVKLTMKAGAVVKHHSHPNEQMTYILKGRIRFTHGWDMEQSTVLCAGDVLHLAANVPHAAECLEDTVDLDVFTPPRRDWFAAHGNDYFAQPAEASHD